MINVDELSDANLRKELINRGVNAGPIVESTRSVYVKKLASLLAKEETQVNNDDINGVLKVIDNVEAVAQAPEKLYPSLDIVEEPVRQRKNVRASVEPSDQDTRAEEEGGSDEEGHEFSRIISDDDLLNDVSQRNHNLRKKANIGKLLLLLALICGGVFLFYFADNLSKLTALDSDEGI
ncbi:unnamed protein product [Auanema sp. JU1783]|nr:unnamed protein product [Auanema sp. JU1783]